MAELQSKTAEIEKSLTILKENEDLLNETVCQQERFIEQTQFSQTKK